MNLTYDMVQFNIRCSHLGIEESRGDMEQAPQAEDQQAPMPQSRSEMPMGPETPGADPASMFSSQNVSLYIN